jgi:hypothetical protein
MTNWTEERIQLALTSHAKTKFYARRWTCVPNVTDWGMPTVVQKNREIDLMCVSGSRWVHAVEIKLSRADLKADTKKRWRLFNDASQVRFEWFAVPIDLADDALALAPPAAGVIAVSTVTRTYQPWGKPQIDVTEWLNEILREPTQNHDARKLNDAEFLLLLRLGVMRMWSKRKAVAA